MSNSMEPDGVVGLCFGFLLGVLVVIAIWSMTGADWRKESVARGYAEYNATTGKWQWKEPKPTKGE